MIPKYSRERLPATRKSVTHKFAVAGHEGYIIVGFYPDGRPGEVFITMAKEGSTIGALLDATATAVSIGLQSGVPLAVYVEKYAHSRFEPSGPTGDPLVPWASSLTDFVFRWLGTMFVEGYREERPQAVPPPSLPESTYEEREASYVAAIEKDESDLRDALVDGPPTGWAVPRSTPTEDLASLAIVEKSPSSLELVTVAPAAVAVKPSTNGHAHHATFSEAMARGTPSGNLCSVCGGVTKRAGACEVCTVCATSTGCG